MRFTILNLIGGFCFAALWIAGLSSIPFVSDPTGMTAGLGVFFLIGLACAAMGEWRTVEWISGALVFLGLIGTVIGFVIAFSGVDPEQAKDIDAVTPMVAALIAGMATALFTTLVGAIGYLWLSLNGHLLCKA